MDSETLQGAIENALDGSHLGLLAKELRGVEDACKLRLTITAAVALLAMKLAKPEMAIGEFVDAAVAVAIDVDVEIERHVGDVELPARSTE